MQNEPMIITIQKPLSGTYCSIDKRKLVEAVRNHQMLEVTLLGVGTTIVDPIWWWDTADKKEKRVVNYANSPMTFVYNHLPLESVFKKNKDKAVNQLNLNL